MSENWKRARKPEQIEARRKSILTAAAELLDAEGVDGTGLSAIARQAGLSKANLYRYFESREAVLLEILKGEIREWSSELEDGLRELVGRRDLEEIAELMGKTAVKRPRFCRLFAALASVLEKNLSVEAIADFQRELKRELNDLILPLREATPELDDDQLFDFLLMHVVYLSGLWEHANPNPSVVEALAGEEFAQMRLDFESRIVQHALTVLRGLDE